MWQSSVRRWLYRRLNRGFCRLDGTEDIYREEIARNCAKESYRDKIFADFEAEQSMDINLRLSS